MGRAIRLSYDTLRMAGYDDPRIAVAALNPHAGDGGTCGMEEIDVLIPTIQEMRAQDMNVIGPVPADTIFMHAFNKEYDTVVTLYHDQGQIATKLKAFDVGVTVSGGMPYAITTPRTRYRLRHRRQGHRQDACHGRSHPHRRPHGGDPPRGIAGHAIPPLPPANGRPAAWVAAASRFACAGRVLRS